MFIIDDNACTNMDSPVSSRTTRTGPSTTPHEPFRFLALPPEIRDLIYAEVLTLDRNACELPDELRSYTPHLSILRVSRLVHTEAARVWHANNTLVRITTPWPQAETHVATEGRVPLLAVGARAHACQTPTLAVAVDVPDMHFTARASAFVLLAADLDAFADMWFYSDLSHPGLNAHLRLTFSFRDGASEAGEAADENGSGGARACTLTASEQRRLLLPFAKVKGLTGIRFEGAHDDEAAQALRTAMAVPYGMSTCVSSTCHKRDADTLLWCRLARDMSRGRRRAQGSRQRPPAQR